MNFDNFNPKNLQPNVDAFMDNFRRDLNKVNYDSIEQANKASYALQGVEELRAQNTKLEDQKDLLIQNNEELRLVSQQFREQNEILTEGNAKLNKQVEDLKKELKEQNKKHYVREGLFIIITGVLTWAITEHWDQIVAILLGTLAK